MLNLDWSNEESILRSLLLSELDEERRTLFLQVHQLQHGCALLHFMDENARTLMTAEDIAFHLRAPPEQVENDLRALADLGLIEQKEVGEFAIFGLVSDPSRRQLVDDLFAWQRRWIERLSRIARAIGGTGVPAEHGPIGD